MNVYDDKWIKRGLKLAMPYDTEYVKKTETKTNVIEI